MPVRAAVDGSGGLIIEARYNKYRLNVCKSLLLDKILDGEMGDPKEIQK